MATGKFEDSQKLLHYHSSLESLKERILEWGCFLNLDEWFLRYSSFSTLKKGGLGNFLKYSTKQCLFWVIKLNID